MDIGERVPPILRLRNQRPDRSQSIIPWCALGSHHQPEARVATRQGRVAEAVNFPSLVCQRQQPSCPLSNPARRMAVAVISQVCQRQQPSGPLSNPARRMAVAVIFSKVCQWQQLSCTLSNPARRMAVAVIFSKLVFASLTVRLA